MILQRLHHAVDREGIAELLVGPFPIVIVAKPFELDLLIISGEVVPSLTFQAGVGIAF